MHWFMIIVLGMALFCGESIAQTPTTATKAEVQDSVVDSNGEVVSSPLAVEIKPEAADIDIQDRMLGILKLTGWFQDISVDVEEGVAFLRGVANRDEHRKWAGDLASKTQGVVAVVNRMTLSKQPLWNFNIISSELQSLLRQTVQSIPFVSIAIVSLFLSWVVAKSVASRLRRTFNRRMGSLLLADVSARAIAVMVFVAGLYIALRISGLTQVAVTLLGGTGLLGLVIGIAFRDIAENFLASILISVQRPFSLGDLIEVDSNTGYVEGVTMRGTLLLMQDGNYVQIPNSMVYKSIIKNLSANPRMRLQFDIPCNSSSNIADLQEKLTAMLKRHEVVLPEPEPYVLIDTVTKDVITLRGFCWISTKEHSVTKVRSALIRASLAITRPPLAFPSANPKSSTQQSIETATPAEKDLSSDEELLRKQVKESHLPERGENLLVDNKEHSGKSSNE